MIYIASDHAGYQLKEELKKFLDRNEYQIEDLNPGEPDPQDDYPDAALLVAKKVIKTGEKGILICGTGQGVCLAANKVAGIRAALAHDDFTGRMAAEHLNANILCLGARVIDPEIAKKIIKSWLEADFLGEERHARRLKKVKEIENDYQISGNNAEKPEV